MLDYGRGGPYSWSTSGEVRRGWTTSEQVRGSMIYLGSMVKHLYGVLGIVVSGA